MVSVPPLSRNESQTDEFLVRKAVAFVLGPDEIRDHVIGQIATAPGDQVVQVFVELIPGRHESRGCVLRDVNAERVADVVGPAGKIAASLCAARPSNAQMMGTG